MARVKQEGAPVHPDDITYEHETSACPICKDMYDRQLYAYLQWEKEFERRRVPG